MILPTLSVIVPCYNEEEVLPDTVKTFSSLLSRLISEGIVSPESYLCFVDDGSQDGTWNLIETYQKSSPFLRGIKLSRNFGHQNALLAGLFSIHADCAITIDADLQDDVNVIEEMIDRFAQGDEIVYGVRKKRETDSFFKRFTAESFYRLMRLFGCNFVYNHADFRLMSKRAIHALKDFSEINLFLRGMVPLLGFRSSAVYFDRIKRIKGSSKYPLRKMIHFAIEGITSFSIVPLKMITFFGFLVFLSSLGVGMWALISKLQGKTVQGWLSMFTMMSFMGGIQILSLGIIGEYIGKIYSEIKRRPRFIVEKNIGFSSTSLMEMLKR